MFSIRSHDRMGDPKRAAGRLEWEATLGGMAKHGTIVRQCCKLCDRSRPVDVNDLAKRLGRAASLWDYFNPCWHQGCEGLTYVIAQPSRSTPMRPLLSYNVWSDGHGGWVFLPIFKGTPAYLNGVVLEE